MDKEWFPSLEEYNPRITKEQWTSFVQDKNIFDENSLITFACIQKAKIATCVDMAEEFGRSFNFYNTNNWRTGERIFKKTNCLLSEREEGGNRFWSVCCLGRESNKGRFEFKIRPELQEAFDVTGVLEGIEVMEGKNISCIMANIAWNENDWKSPSDNKTNFRWTQVEGNIPNESWNFDFDNPRNSEKEILGFTQFKNPPKNAGKDKFLIIFRSDNKIIGFYGNAEIKKVPLPIKVDEYVNLLGDKKLSVLLENKIDDSNHNFLFGKDRISQGGFNYLNPINAQTILDEAIKTNPNQIDTLEKIKEWLNQGDTRMEGQYWLIAPGENARKWDEYSKSGEIGIGWEELGNIGKYDSDYDSFQNDYIKIYQSANDNYRGSSPKQIWDFYKNIEIGDIIFARKGVRQIVGMGKVISDYIYDDSRDEYKSIRKVEWKKIGEWNYPGQSSRDTVHNLKPEQAEEILTIMSNKMTGYEEKLDEIKENLEANKNVILTGAPGTGKTFMAKTVAARIILEREINDFDKDLTEEEKKQVESQTDFVQFHPSYDYTDFVEGLRPKQVDSSDQIGFERKDGVFKAFCEKALKNLVDSRKSKEELAIEKNIIKAINDFLSISTGKDNLYYSAYVQKDFYIDDIENEKFKVYYSDGKLIGDIELKELEIILHNIEKIKKETRIIETVGEILNRQKYHKMNSYIWVLCEKIVELIIDKNENFESIPLKSFVFIIDEINRGEVAKIFGELFYCVDPGYRGEKGKINTQYQNLINENNVFHSGFFIPENVYIIGTMNDIDRSVESMDFAFRRRFSWIEVKAEDTQYMLDAELDAVLAKEAKRRMENLNAAIWSWDEKEKKSKGIDGLNDAYHIGASYFLKLKNYGGDFGKLWDYHIKGILTEYLRGNPNAQEELTKLKAAYDKVEELKAGE